MRAQHAPHRVAAALRLRLLLLRLWRMLLLLLHAIPLLHAQCLLQPRLHLSRLLLLLLLLLLLRRHAALRVLLRHGDELGHAGGWVLHCQLHHMM